MGWAKATKLAGRSALQGLVAVKFDKNHGALVELNCETDFVAKNDKFQKMIEDAAIACFKLAHTNMQSKGPVTKVHLINFFNVMNPDLSTLFIVWYLWNFLVGSIFCFIIDIYPLTDFCEK